MKQKNLSILLGVLIFSMMTMISVSAQEPISNLSILAGQVGQADFASTSTADSLTQGGLISQIIETRHSTVKLAGNIVSDKVTISMISNFSLYLFGASAIINWNSISAGDTYQISNSATVRNITGVWNTLNVNSSTVYPTWAKKITLNTLLTTKFGENITATVFDNGQSKITINGEVLQLTTCASNPACPSLANLNLAFGTTGAHDRFMSNYTMNGHGYPVIAYDNAAGTIWYQAIDVSGNGNWVFTNSTVTSSGFKTQSIGGQVLALVPANNNYDLFAVI